MVQEVIGENEITAVEILGGAMRMGVLQSALLEVLPPGMTLGAKFDESSVALGAALIANKRNSEEKEKEMELEMQSTTIGLTPSELDFWIAKEIEMEQNDQVVRQLLSRRNAAEAFVLDMRSAIRSKHGSKINGTELNRILDDIEEKLWSCDDDTTGNTEELLSQVDTLSTQARLLCSDYYAAVAEEKKKVEEDLNKCAEDAELERENGQGENGDEVVMKDTRKLKKADRMRLVVKNKEEGTELFKGKKIFLFFYISQFFNSFV